MEHNTHISLISFPTNVKTALEKNNITKTKIMPNPLILLIIQKQTSQRLQRLYKENIKNIKKLTK
jgi:hypothetical protein